MFRNVIFVHLGIAHFFLTERNRHTKFTFIIAYLTDRVLNLWEFNVVPAEKQLIKLNKAEQFVLREFQYPD
jgi:hypothetical protein